MNEEGVSRAVGPSRRALLAGGGLIAALAASAGVGVGAVAMAAGDRHRSSAPAPVVTPTPTRTPTPTPTLPPPPGPPTPEVELHPAPRWPTQTFLLLPETGEWFTTQAKGGTSRLVDPNSWAVGDIVVSRLASDGTFLDSMELPDAGHGMGLIMRIEAGVKVVYSCWYAPGATGALYDVVRIPYTPGVAARSAATTVVAGVGFPLDPIYDATTDSVTVRHQGGGGPEYTRHAWQDFVAGNLSRPTGAVATSDSPPTHQGFCSVGDRFFFYTGAASDAVGGDPALITEYSWVSGAVVRPPIDASGNSRLPDGAYPGGRMEPEGATIVVDSSGAAALVVGLTTGGGAARSPMTYPTFRYPLPSA